MNVGNSSSPLLEVKTYFVFSFLFPFGLDLILSLSHFQPRPWHKRCTLELPPVSVKKR